MLQHRQIRKSCSLSTSRIDLKRKSFYSFISQRTWEAYSIRDAQQLTTLKAMNSVTEWTEAHVPQETVKGRLTDFCVCFQVATCLPDPEAVSC